MPSPLLPSACCLLLAATLSAADWYVAPDGSDGATGSEAAPWATIAKALGSSGSNDRILLRRDGTWRETFTIGGGRQLLPYGSGAGPVITGSSNAAFTGFAGSIRSVVIPAQVQAVWIDGTWCRLARYPNADANPAWLRLEAGSTNTSIVDSGLKTRAAGRFAGAQVRWRRWSWWYETRQITADGGTNTLTLANDMPSGTTGSDYAGNSLGSSPDGQGSCYYIDNDIEELDAPGEWFWGGGTLSVYPPSGAPAASVEYVTSTAGIIVNGATIQGIAFTRFGGTALTVNSPSTITDCSITEVEGTGIATTWNAAPTVIRGCTLRDVRNNGIYTNENPAGTGGTLIERNTLQRIGMERGYGGSGTWHQAGIILGNAKTDTVRLNRFIDIGYCGVIAGAAGQTIDRNLLVRTMSTLNDGAAIYTNCSSTTITGNLILDTVGDLSNSHPWWPLGHGIWPEFLSDFHDQVIDDNTVFGSSGAGLKLDNEYTCTIRRNILADNRTSGLQLGVQVNNGTSLNDYGVAENTDDDLRAQNHTITDNVIAACAPTRRVTRPENLNSWWLPPYTAPLPNLISSYGSVDFGTMGSSIFVLPLSGTDAYAATNPTRSWTTLGSWSTANLTWAQPSGWQATGNAYLLINDTESTTSMPVPASGNWTLADGTPVSGSVSVASYRTVTLLTLGSLPGTPYTVASGIDWRAANPLAPPTGGGGGGGGSGGGTPTAGGGGGGCGAGTAAALLLSLCLGAAWIRRR